MVNGFRCFQPVALKQNSRFVCYRGWAGLRDSVASRIAHMTNQMTEYQRRLVEILVLAKYARTEEERARHFITAEKWSAQARGAERRPRSGEIQTG
jgi:hypothetical protein